MQQSSTALENLIVFHRVHEPFHGDTLYPLNALRSIAPELYEEHAAKYAWRLQLLKRRVTPLDCLWNDVLHFSPVHPAKISESLVAAGRPPLQGRFFAIPVSTLDPAAVAILLSYKPPLSPTTYTAENQSPIDLKFENLVRYKLLSEARPEDVDVEVPEHTKEYYAFEVAHGRRPLLFNGISHVLYRGSIHIAGAEVINV